jgi:hypothetical protein
MQLLDALHEITIREIFRFRAFTIELICYSLGGR